MKAALNGALNASVLDGWWDEAYQPEIGWAIGDRAARWGDDHVEDRNDADARATHELIERQIAPLFYARDAAGYPRAWLAMVRASIRAIGPRFSATRMAREYFRDVYELALPR
jgi:starch phosphorylase